ncbi:hypothetical protein BJ165DRAFT_1475549 [Panaeolus papilionaceus]|nr:hypothetical protein BJ165DRAFT_1475549 [Panaeolus papilionaceus]
MAELLPNPTTPMAFLPPDLAFQVTISSYILVGSCGVLVWDILDNLTGDYKLLTKHHVGLATIAYFVSRLGSLGYVLASTIFETAGITDNCNHFDQVVTTFYPLAIPMTALLFLFRVRAVFDRNKYVVAFFTFMWLAVLGGCITVSQGVTGANIGPTKYCINFAFKPYIGAGGIIPVVNDTLVFLAISWRLLANARTQLGLQTRMNLKELIAGDYLPAFSRAIFQDGQAYYLTTVTTNLVAVIMFYINVVPPTYRSMFTVPNVALMNIMACRVFRKTKFGVFREVTISTSHSTKVSRGRTPNGFALPIRSAPHITTEVITDRDYDTIDITRSIDGHSKTKDWV